MDSQTTQGRHRLGFIGAGKLAGSVIRGLLRAKFCRPNEIIASEPNEEARAALAKVGIDVTTENTEVAQAAEVIFIGVKPAVVLPVLGGAQLAGESKRSPDELRAMVVTPGGTTAAGLAAMEKFKTSEGLIAAVKAATERGHEMAKENL